MKVWRVTNAFIFGDVIYPKEVYKIFDPYQSVGDIIRESETVIGLIYINGKSFYISGRTFEKYCTLIGTENESETGTPIVKDAIEINYDNSTSELPAKNVQTAIDTLALSNSTKVLALPQEYIHNPVLAPTTDRAYYPSLLYFSSGFVIEGVSYKYLVIYALDVDAGGGLLLSGSNDFITWVQVNSGNPLVGLPAAASHAQVIKVGNVFRIYYWDSAVNIYQVAAIRTAVSTDLINWTSDFPLQNGVNPIIHEDGISWNRGSYGPCHLIYNETATNIGTNPFDYSYVMYYDGTTGAFEDIGLGYSVDGITFNLYGKILAHGSDVSGGAMPWDSSYATFGSIIKTSLGTWLMFYSGGKLASSEGVGVAISEDGLLWTKLTTNAPLIGLLTGTWREQRCYAVTCVTDFTNRFSGAGELADVKILVSGKATKYTCGYFKIEHMYINAQEALYRLGKI